VIKKDGTLIGNFVGGVTAHAAALTSTGFTVDMTGKTPRVQNYRQYLVESLE
jgi:transposase-like protein